MIKSELAETPEGEQDVIHSQGGEYFGDIAARAISRRSMLVGGAGTAAALVVTPMSANAWYRRKKDPGDRLQFQTIPEDRTTEAELLVPPGYEYQVLLTWGTPLSPDAPAFDVDHQSKESQEQQVGFNHDLVMFYPLPRFVERDVCRDGDLSYLGSRILGAIYPFIAKAPTRNALVCINHEYTTGRDMFRSYTAGDPDQVGVEVAAHGATIAELEQGRDGSWHFNQASPFNRRVTGFTPIGIAGPLRGHDLLKTSTDPHGVEVLGMFNNCAGGKTPWGTLLTCEENFDQYFGNAGDLTGEAAATYEKTSKRIAANSGSSGRRWEEVYDRFDVSKEPNEYHKMGYVVEIDPYDPSSLPLKRTALGRFKHEGAQCVLSRHDRAVVYSGDDARFEYVYKFVSKGRFNRRNRKGNMKLLDEGTLYVARFDGPDVQNGQNMGSGEWLPLEWKPGNALDQAGFKSQAEVLLNTRGAADVLGATPMDRPEDVDVSAKTGKVYIALTNNSRRTGTDPDSTREAQGREVSSWYNSANPRLDNENGHIIELIEKNGDNGATKFYWNIFILCGEPDSNRTAFGDVKDPVAAGVSRISDPDNVAIDDDGNLWIATDGMPGGIKDFDADGNQIDNPAKNDGVFAVPTEGADRGLLRQFLSGVPGCEICGPEFSGDNRTFFCAIQHPRDGEAFDTPWPTGEPVAKPALVAVRNKRGRKIGQ